jgi:uncharacterized protein (DUF58 family)
MRITAFMLFLCAMTLMSLAEGLVVTCVALLLCVAGAALVASRQLGELEREAEQPEVRVHVHRWNY